MNEDERARPVAPPVSGEIMTAGEACRPVRPAAGEFIDADYETVGTQTAAPARFAAAAPATGMDMLRTDARAIDTGSKRGGPLFWTIGLALVALAFWASGGQALVRHHAAALAPAANDTPLTIGEVESRVERHGDRDMLFVEGRARNPGGQAQELPAIEIAVTANDGATTRYFLETRAAELAPGERYAFSSRLEAPGNGVRSVAVTFREEMR